MPLSFLTIMIPRKRVPLFTSDDRARGSMSTLFFHLDINERICEPDVYLARP